MSEGRDETDRETDSEPERVDGRVARRQRNIDSVLDIVVEMFSEDAMFPTIEQVRDRSGLSLRSLYRYFASPAELLEAVIERTERSAREMSVLHAIGEGPLDRRIEDFVALRLRVHEHFGSTFRASIANAPRHPRVRGQLARGRDRMRSQFVLQFEPELAARRGPDRDTLLAAGDLLTQLESVDYLRRHRGLTVEETRATLIEALTALLT